MVTQKRPDPKPLCWFEIPVKDTLKARKFYAELFGWTYQEFKEFESDYWIINSGEGSLNGGFVKSKNGVSSGGIILFLHVVNIQKVITQAIQLGGSIVEEESTITKETGNHAKIMDLDGNTIGLWSE